MLIATPTSWFSWNYTVSEQGQVVADVTVNWMGESGTLQVDGKSYDLHRQAMLAGEFVAQCDDQIVAEAEKPSALHRRFVVRFAGRELETKALSPFTRTFGVYEAGRKLGEIGPRHLLTRKATVALPKDIPLDVQLFMFWLSVLMCRRQASSAAS